MDEKVTKKINHKKSFYCCGHGVGIVKSIKKIQLNGTRMEEYYQIALEDTNMEINIPIRSVTKAGLRNLISYEEASLLFSNLKGGVSKKFLKGPWHKRIKIIKSLLCSPNPQDVAQLIKELTLMERGLKITYDEKIYLKRARNLVTCEIANVTGESKENIQNKITGILSELK